MPDSKVPPEWGRDSFGFHRQAAFMELARSPRFPQYVRVHYAALARHRASGHAKFEMQELAEILGKRVKGEWVSVDRRTVKNAIDRAVVKGLLDSSSKALCLVLPFWQVAGGLGEIDERCPRAGHRARSAER